ncbi:hypothetical protein QF034_002364 [Streptomyces africanus]|uniref:Uncharacterized protein n=1 Tax=Streptomyces africanus TaxID=231024 RepID=A0ABU0QL66_9ACTN|nr:hypothetical protein [Streptomyces africanus]MDQ0748133.1 hypothetical protein [Streptomyces africanus]
MQWRLDAQYARIAEHAPQLLTDSLAALHHTTGAEQLHAAHLLATTARSATQWPTSSARVTSRPAWWN